VADGGEDEFQRKSGAFAPMLETTSTKGDEHAR
jgi:hypothetical protein